MKILNLYAGIGGNRKLWGNDHEITAVEYDAGIASIYKNLYPNDTVIVADAHRYLLDHFKEFDFIWSSPPCPTHSKLVTLNYSINDLLSYPDMSLYQEVIILQHFFKGKYCIENVMGYYKPLIHPQESGRHYFWANFKIPNIKVDGLPIKGETGLNIKEREVYAGYNDFEYKEFKGDKTKIFKNMVSPEIGLAIFESALNIYNHNKVEQVGLFALPSPPVNKQD